MEVEGLYVCDAGAFPEALDRLAVLTILCVKNSDNKFSIDSFRQF